MIQSIIALLLIGGLSLPILQLECQALAKTHSSFQHSMVLLDTQSSAHCHVISQQC